MRHTVTLGVYIRLILLLYLYHLLYHSIYYMPSIHSIVANEMDTVLKIWWALPVDHKIKNPLHL